MKETFIDAIGEFDRDWDWFAVDDDGAIGHFTTAGIRSLPRGIKADKEAALKLIEYFSNHAPRVSECSIRAQAEVDCGGWIDEQARDRYLRSFRRMASTGLFSYDTCTAGPRADYFMVAFPSRPLLMKELPAEVRDLISRTRSNVRFSITPLIPAASTLTW